MGRRGRPPLPDACAIRTFIRFVELVEDGAGIGEAERQIIEDGGRPAIGSPQGVRKRRTKGEFIAFCATVMLADLSYYRRP